MTLYKHKNLTHGTFSVQDSEGECYALGPGQELVLDKDNSWEGRIEVEKTEEKKISNKLKKEDE